MDPLAHGNEKPLMIVHLAKDLVEHGGAEEFAPVHLEKAIDMPDGRSGAAHRFAERKDNLSLPPLVEFREVQGSHVHPPRVLCINIADFASRAGPRENVGAGRNQAMQFPE